MPEVTNNSPAAFDPAHQDWSKLADELFAGCPAARRLCELLICEGRVAVSLFDANLTYLYLSPALSEMFGAPIIGALGKRLSDGLPGPEGLERASIVERALAGDKPVMVVEMFDGLPATTVVHRIDRPTGGPLALAVHRVGAEVARVEADPDRYDVVRPQHARITPLAQLSGPELSVLRLIAQGYSSAQIAHAIHRTVKTVEWHRAALGRKLGVKTRVELARLAIRYGLVGANEPIQHAPEA
ncbi:MAG: PAS domain-containing protein [Phycisphaeraceae bacterium]|nr:PAS domain-containing protein [Phycisphaeraceae bacterium]